jgi:Na+-driven multidrug efflux pump
LAVATLVEHRLGIVGIWLALTCWLAARTVLLGRQWSSRRWAAAAAGEAQGRTAPMNPGMNTLS